VKKIITAALSGAFAQKDVAQEIPITPDEIAADVVNVAREGAAVAHIHARDKNGGTTLEVPIFEEIYEKSIKGLKQAGLDIIFNFSTAGIYPDGSNADTDTRLAFLYSLEPEMCSFNPGSINWLHKFVYMNPPEYLQKLGKLTQELNIKPEFEIFDTHMINNVKQLIKDGYVKEPCHFQFVFGLSHAMPTDLRTFAYFIDCLPEGSTWTVAGIGRYNMQMILAALAADAEGIRVGMEDNIYLYKGVPGSNTAQVKRAVELIKLTGNEIATAEEAREMLGVKNRK